MIELIAHDLIQHGNLKKWVTFRNDDVLRNYEVVFGKDGITNLNKAIVIYQKDFYEIKRYYQFVGVVAYKHSLGMLTMRLFESEAMDNFLDGFINLKDQNWKSEDLNIIGKITQEIINDNNKELAMIRIEKLL